MNSRIIKLINGARWSLILALAVCALGARAHAQNENAAAPEPAPQQTEQPRPNEGELQLLPKLNLSDEQREQLRVIAQQRNQERFTAQIRLRQARRALNQAINAENPDQNLINERVRDVAAAQEDITRLEAQAAFKVRQVLTPEQLRTFRQLVREQREANQRRRRLEGLNPPGGQRLPGPNQTPNVRNQNNNNPMPADLMRERRRQRRQLNNPPRRP